MPVKLTCPTCKEDFTIATNRDDITTIEDTHYATMDCPNKACEELLYSHEKRGIIPFHAYMHEQTDGVWDKDGKNTGYVDIKHDEPEKDEPT